MRDARRIKAYSLGVTPSSPPTERRPTMDAPMRRKLLSLAISAIALVVAAVVAVPGLVQAQQPIRIGATMSMTGAYDTQGIPARNGYLLCQKHVNEKGGILGRKIEFLIHDDKSDPKVAIELYEKLITEDKVDAVMGPYGST